MRPLVLILLAALLVPTLAASSLHAEEVVITEKARLHFRAGVNFLRDPDGARYEEAYQQFKLAYAESPSWKILGNLGIATLKLERDGEAITAIRGYLDGGGDEIDLQEREQFKRDLETLEAGVVWVTFSSVPTGAFLVDERVPLSGRPIINRYQELNEPLRLGLHAGRHRIKVTLDGYQPAEWEFDAVAGEELSHEFQLELLPEDEPGTTPTPGGGGTGQGSTPATERPTPTLVYVGAAVTGALVVGGAVTGVLALGKHSKFDDQNGNLTTDQQRADAEDLRSQGQTLNLVADVMFGGAVVAGVVTTILYINRPTVAVGQDRGVTVTPLLGNRVAGLGMSGSF